MRVNAKALLKVAGIGCLFDEGGGPLRPARVALVTEETVRAACALAASDPSLNVTDRSPRVRYGGALGYVDAGSGPARRVVLAPGEGETFRLACGMRFLGRHMLDAEQALQGRGGEEHSLLRNLIRSVLTLVSSVPDPERFPDHLIAQSCRFRLRDTFGEALLPITDDALVAKFRSDLARTRIADLDPTHPDALNVTTPLARILDQVGLDVRMDGVEIPGIGRVTRVEARRLTEAGPYRSGLFGRLTRSSPSRIDAIVLPLKDARTVEGALSGTRLTGAWVDQVGKMTRELTGSEHGGLRLTVSLYVAEGRDLLLMTDMIGEMNGVALLFSWPTHERVPVLEASSGPVYAFCPEEVPSPLEVLRCERVFAEIFAFRQSASILKQALDA